VGEIADALRRAREAESRGESQAAEPAASPITSPLPDLPGEPARPGSLGRAPSTRLLPSRVIEDLSEADRSLALFDEGALDACRSVALRVRAALARADARSLAIVSAARSEGKTTVAWDLALALGSLSRNEGEVALVDLDLRRPSVAKKIGVDVELGIEQFLLGGAELDDVRMLIRRPRIDLYAAGSPVRGTHELLTSPRFADLIHELESRHSVVLVDAPPDLVASDSALILEHVAACVLVARVGFTRVRRFRQLVASLPRHKILGGVLNDVHSSEIYDYQRYHHDEDLAEEDGAIAKRRWRRRGSSR
jgi:Mrp family chromosome partitioning ATPase